MRSTGLAGKVVIVTGAAAGIGRATALAFAREGSRVSALDINETRGAELVEDSRGAGGEVQFRKVDVTSAEAVEQATVAVWEQWGRVDVLINNAGIVRDAQLVKVRDSEVVARMSEADFSAVIDVNLRAVFLCTRAVVPHMIKSGGGVILSASSVVGLYGNFGQTNYTAAKGGLIAMTRTWARELGRHKIRVNAVAPGFIGTEILNSMPQKVLEGLIARTPLRRLGQPEDIADAYVWLASNQASFVHGTVLSVDGGLVIGT